MPAPHTDGRWWVLGNVTLVNLIGGGLAWHHVLALSPDILADLDLGVAEWGVLWSGINLGILVFSIPAGVLGDRFGARRTVATGLAVCAATLLLRSRAGDFHSMLALMVAFGSGFSLLGANLPKALGVWFPPERLGLANGVSLAGFSVGSGTALLATASIASRIGGWRRLSLFLGFLVLAVGVCWLVAVREAPAGSTPRGRILASMAQVVRVRDLWIVAACYLFFYGGFLGALGYLPIYLARVQGMTRELAGAVVSFAAWTYIAGSLLLPAFSDRLGLRKIVYTSGILISGAALFATAFLHGPLLVLASITWGFFTGALGLLFVVPVEMKGVGRQLAGTAIGLTTSAGFLGGVIFPMIGMSLAEHRPLTGFAFFLACCVTSALLFTAIRETGPGAKPDPGRA